MLGRTVIEIPQGIICVDSHGVYGIGDNSGPVLSFECKGYKYLKNKNAWAKKAKYYHFSGYDFLGSEAKSKFDLPQPYPC